MTYLKLIFILLFSSLIYAKPIILDENTKFKDILSQAEIYIDKSEKLTIDDIKSNKYLFKYNNSSTLSFGYSPNFNVWIKFTLYNSSNKTLHKIIEYANPLTTNIIFFDPNKNYKKEESGLVFKNANRNTVNPIFSVEIKPKQSATYFINASSHITTLIVKLKLWKEENFFQKEIKHQIVLTLFFGAMFILAVYNLFIYFFTKDISYLYYVLYIFGIIIHHLLYIGFANIYLLEPSLMIKTIEAASIVVAIPVIALGLFTKSFLQIKQYPIHNKILNTFLILIPISIIFFLLTDDYDRYRNLLTLLLMFYLIFITIYSALKKNRQAYFILFGWCLIFLAVLFMFLSSQGIFNIHQYFSYYIETTLVLEALVFSIALADKINNLQKEKNDANDKLILQQKNETERLSKEVDLRTKDLKDLVDEKELLLKELNHRVKNNMQMIVSLIRLQADDIKNHKLNEVLLTIQNRIKAMSHLHELLYKQDNITYINAYEYFDVLIEELKDTYEDDIDIYLDVQTELKMEYAIYCGLILNELLTNSFKYAFPDKQGEICIELKNKNHKTYLTVRDNGTGYEKNNKKNSLGLILVSTLAKNQLKGEININSSNGVTTEIFWKNDD